MNLHDLFETSVPLAGASSLAVALLAFGLGYVLSRALRVRVVRAAIGFFAAGLVLKAILSAYKLPNQAEGVSITTAHGILILGGVLIAYGLWDALCERILSDAQGLDRRAQKLLIPVLQKLVRFLILTTGFVVALGVFGVNVVGIVAGLGIGGIVVALAAKDSVENVFGSITVLFDMPFALGDWVKIGAIEGVVEEINLRSTRIRTFEDSVVTLPNSNLIKASVENFGARRFRRQRFHVRFTYESDPETLEAFCVSLRAALARSPNVEADRSFVEVNDLAESTVGVLVLAFFVVDSYSQEVRMRHELLTQILALAQAHGLRFVGVAAP